MVTIGLSASAVARIRFAISPLWETIASLRVLRDPGGHAIHLPWAARVRQLDVSRLAGLVSPTPGYIPDFLTPTPPGPFPGLEEELAVLAATPADVIEAQSGAALDPERLAQALREYFAAAIAPDWPRIRGLLEAEVYARARSLAADGVGGLLNDLHANVSFADGTLSVLQRWCTADDVRDGGDLVLVPSVFVWPSVLTVFGAQAQLAYPPRGVGVLWESRGGAGRRARGAFGGGTVGRASGPGGRAGGGGASGGLGGGAGGSGAGGGRASGGTVHGGVDGRVSGGRVGRGTSDRAGGGTDSSGDGGAGGSSRAGGAGGSSRAGGAGGSSVVGGPSGRRGAGGGMIGSGAGGRRGAGGRAGGGVVDDDEVGGEFGDGGDPLAALAALVGRARARLLAELAAPASTTDLARRTGLTPGGVSQHLAVLRASGLVSAHREGRAVINVRTGTAEVLLDANGIR
ncbi:helix-turn-helix domain-containing protein [Dactylosporangium sp. McL0621]|uniref:ArsR/SmtB family transcription factor n=1 Tax=Dactylosporangium sp. McL0621 TaxID=3415678 RepID=UPI003CF23AB4